MKNRGLLVLALVLIALGVVGLVALAFVDVLAPGATTGAAGAASVGREIYYTGSVASGPIPRTSPGFGMGPGMMAGVGCVTCHREDGRGGGLTMMGRVIEVPDIRYSVLSRSRSEDGTTVPGWTDAEIITAITDGVEPSGERLKWPMPRWALTGAQADELLAYLKELN